MSNNTTKEERHIRGSGATTGVRDNEIWDRVLILFFLLVMYTPQPDDGFRGIYCFIISLVP